MIKIRKPRFEKSEIIYLILSAIAAFVLVILISIPFLNKFISNRNPIIQFLILNLGLYAVFMLFFKGIALGKKRVWEGVLGTILGFIAIDLLLPEFHVTAQGLVVGGMFGASASDYFFGYIYSIMHIPFSFIINMPAWLVFIGFLFIMLFIFSLPTLILMLSDSPKRKKYFWSTEITLLIVDVFSLILLLVFTDVIGNTFHFITSSHIFTFPLMVILVYPVTFLLLLLIGSLTIKDFVTRFE